MGQFCLGDTQLQEAFEINQEWGVSSIACGPLVEAILCPGGTEEVITGEDNLFQCENQEPAVVEIGARQLIDSLLVDWSEASIILVQHPWIAKGDIYLSYSRKRKAHILREKIRADPTTGPQNNAAFFQISDLKELFDLYGDE